MNRAGMGNCFSPRAVLIKKLSPQATFSSDNYNLRFDSITKSCQNYFEGWITCLSGPDLVREPYFAHPCFNL